MICCFAIIVVVDTIYSASSWSSLKFTGVWYYSSCSLAAPWFLLRPCHAFSGSSLGGGYMKISSQPVLVHYIYMCVHFFFFIRIYLWLVLVFLFSRVYYGFTPLRHQTSRHYAWRQCNNDKIKNRIITKLKNKDKFDECKLSHIDKVYKKKYKFLQYHWVSKFIILSVGKSAKEMAYCRIQCVPMHCSIRFTPMNYNNNRWELKLNRFFLISLI